MTLLRFGDLELNEDEGTLFLVQDGIPLLPPVELSPRLARVATVLLRSQGRLCLHADVLAVLGHGHATPEDGRQAISAIRQAMQGVGSRCILRTRKRYGYVLLSPPSNS